MSGLLCLLGGMLLGTGLEREGVSFVDSVMIALGVFLVACAVALYVRSAE